MRPTNLHQNFIAIEFGMRRQTQIKCCRLWFVCWVKFVKGVGGRRVTGVGDWVIMHACMENSKNFHSHLTDKKGFFRVFRITFFHTHDAEYLHWKNYVPAWILITSSTLFLRCEKLVSASKVFIECSLLNKSKFNLNFQWKHPFPPACTRRFQPEALIFLSFASG